ncbi:MAG: hypothetical protein N4A72_14655 [Bacteroidales bacterium]|jgi:hypothetical protein|nr:hypothetical protein [Bacteroidales bacterium]
MILRLFTSGTHKGLTFSNDNIDGIYNKTTTGNIEKIPVVLGHPKNDLPVVGWVKKTALKLYDEKGKKSIGFERADAEFSEESIDALKELKRDKISVRLKDGAITHIGMVKNPAVEENAYQEFSEEGELFFNAVNDFSFKEPSMVDTVLDFLQSVVNGNNNINNNNNQKPDKKMTEKEKELEAKNKELQEKLDKKEKQAHEDAQKEKVDAFKEEFSKEEYKGKVDFAQVLRIAKVLAGVKEPLEFEKEGETVKKTAINEFSAVLKSLVAKPSKKVIQGSVTQFSKGDGDEGTSGVDELRDKFSNL